jgi:uncharacterized protein YecE (DUF72 family)
VKAHVGCSGWNYQSWRHGVFYPPRCPARLWLDYYARFFDTVEVNATFYRLPTAKAVQGWIEQTPPGFVLTIKMSRYVTHVKRLRDLRPSLELFYDRIAPLVGSPKLGPMLWQLPASFRRDDDRLAAALTHLPPGRHCFEFRHPSWFARPVFEHLRAHDAALVLGHDGRRDPFPFELTAAWTFIRFHYGERGRRGNYSESELRSWAAEIRSLRAGAEVFAYFNNDWEAFAPRNALRLRRLLET